MKVRLEVIWMAYAVVRLTKKPMHSAAVKPSGLRTATARPLLGSSASRSHTAAHASSSAPHAGLMYTSTWCGQFSVLISTGPDQILYGPSFY